RANLREVHRWLSGLGDADRSDGELLDRFIAGEDAAAFEALVRRHGPMVLGVCRRVLRNEADVEDAFQAVFLVLVRNARSVRKGGTVGNWLHGVAHRTALKARAMNQRWDDRRSRELDRQRVAPEPGPAADELKAFDEELSRLPEGCREAVVLCE